MTKHTRFPKVSGPGVFGGLIQRIRGLCSRSASGTDGGYPEIHLERPRDLTQADLALLDPKHHLHRDLWRLY
jgi:hypothetical protein